MARQDIITCLKNALERGQDIEDVKLSLINAGYPRQEINEAYQELQQFTVKQIPQFKAKFIPELPKPTKKE